MRLQKQPYNAGIDATFPVPMPPALPALPFSLRPLMASLLVGGACLFQVPAHAAPDDPPTPPSLLLAQSYTARPDLAHYLVSEKLDGVRAYWDGKTLRFRSGRVIQAPAWFTAPFPSHPLDGELWMGRRRFEEVSAAVRRQQPVDAEWREISYQLYELPNGAGSFEERVAALRTIATHAGVPWLQVVEQTRVTNDAALRKKLAHVLGLGGEGLMLHRADAAWQTGRSDVLLKLKPQHDAEAVVVAYEAGKGKYRGLVGALIVETPDGRRFRLGTGLRDRERHDPPAIGATVTYRYRELTANGSPRFASFLRVRERE